jgi:hypothetical protein
VGGGGRLLQAAVAVGDDLGGAEDDVAEGDFVEGSDEARRAVAFEPPEVDVRLRREVGGVLAGALVFGVPRR